jgi:hypothetical protein
MFVTLITDRLDNFEEKKINQMFFVHALDESHIVAEVTEIQANIFLPRKIFALNCLTKTVTV